MIKPVLTLEDTGLKTSQPPKVTVTEESEFRASIASAVGPSGVSAQATKPTETTAKDRRMTSIAFLLSRKSFHPHIPYFALPQDNAFESCPVAQMELSRSKVFPHSAKMETRIFINRFTPRLFYILGKENKNRGGV
jgi:hypothetical protein